MVLLELVILIKHNFTRNLFEYSVEVDHSNGIDKNTEEDSVDSKLWA